MKALLILFILFLFTGCAISEKYNEYYVKTPDQYGWNQTQHIEYAYIKANLKFKKVKVKYLGEKHKYKIEDYRFVYPRYYFRIFKRRKDAKGIVITCDEGTIIKIDFNSDATLDIPKNENYDLSDTIIYFNYDYGL